MSDKNYAIFGAVVVHKVPKPLIIYEPAVSALHIEIDFF